MAAAIAILPMVPIAVWAATWSATNPGNLLTNSNWSGGLAPNGIGQTAQFTTQPTGAGDYTLNGAMTVSTLTSNNTGQRTITGSGTLTFQVSTGEALFQDRDGAGGVGSGFLNLDVDNVMLASTTHFFPDTAPISVSSEISGSGGVIKTGAETLSFSNNNNSYTGLNDIREGVFSGSSITNSGTNSAFGRGNFVLSNGGTLRYSGVLTSTNRSIALGAGGGVIDVAQLTQHTPLKVSGVISGVGALTKAGSGALVLSNANTYSGGTTINGGWLYADSTSGSATGSGDITINNSGTLVIWGAAVSGNINNNGHVQFGSTTYAGQISGTGSVSSYGAVSLTGQSTYGGDTYVDEGTLSITNGGSVTNSHHAYIGSYGDIVEVYVGGGSGNSSWTNSGDVYVSSQGNGYSTLNIIGGGSVASANGYVGGPNTYSDDNSDYVTVGGGTGSSTWTISDALYVGGGYIDSENFEPAYIRITGGGGVSNTTSYIGESGPGVVIVGGGTGNSVWTNTGALNLSSDNFDGYLEIYAGGLVSAAALDRGNQVSLVYLDGGTLRITASDEAGSEIVLGTGGGTIDVPTVGTTFAIDAIYGDGALGSLTKEGAGTLAINFANPYSGTTINGGTVSVNVPIDPSGGIGNGPVTVNNGGTLAGTGSITGSVANSGIIAPGTSVGTLSIGSLYQDTSGKLQFELASAASYDQLNVAGSMTLAGTLEVLLSGGYAPAAGSVFDILDFASRTGTFDTLTLPSLDPSLVWDTSQFYISGVLSIALAGDYNSDDAVDAADYVAWRKNGGTLDGYDTWRTNFGRLVYDPCSGGASCVGSGGSQDPIVTSPGPLAVVPEPSTFALAAVALGWAAARRRRRDPDCLATVRRIGQLQSSLDP